MEKSNNWKYEIKIKHLFTSETTPETIIVLCTELIKQLTNLIQRIEKSNVVKDEQIYFIDHLQEIIDNLNFLLELANGTIPESEFDDYSFDGNYESEFNMILESLYDLADSRISCTNDISEKFLWIG
jgi:hypothetical protein